MTHADDFSDQNRRSWNHATAAHNSHKLDQAKYLAEGEGTLFGDEVELLGDVRGRRIVHLQCNSGQDTLSLARRGADMVGVDLSDEAVRFARELSAESGIAARFERGEVIAWMNRAAASGRRFDVAFASYGAIPWIQDLEAWMRGVRSVLVPGGRLVLLEFHPLVWSITTDPATAEPYFMDEPLHEPGVVDYVRDSGDGLAPMGFTEGITDFENPEPSVCFQWTVADTVNAVISSGLTLTQLVEYPHANGCRIHKHWRELPGRRYTTPEGSPSLPLMLGLTATRAE